MRHSNVISLRADGQARGVPLLVLVDLQQEYVSEGRLHQIRDVKGPLENCRRLIEAARMDRWPIANVRWLQRADHFNRKLKFSSWIEDFRPQASDMVFEKEGASCFSDKAFSEMMEHGAGDIAVIAGFTGAIACLATALDGAARGHTMIFSADASASRGAGTLDDPSAHTAATFVISQHARVETTEDIIAMFANDGALGGRDGYRTGR